MLGSLFTQLQVTSRGSERERGQSQQQTPALADFIRHIRNLTGLKKNDIYSNLRVPDQFENSDDDINVVILTGQGIFCVDVKPWSGTVSAHNRKWHVRVKEEARNVTNTCIEQIEDPLKAITAKAADLCGHLKRSGVSVRRSLFFPRVVFLSPDLELDEDLRRSRELVSHSQTDDFLRSLREGYVAWISDALTPSWLSGHLSYRQMDSVREVLGRVGTWDLLRLHCGGLLKGDFQGCQYIALDRDETDTLEFSRVKVLSPDLLLTLLGHTPQETSRQGVTIHPMNQAVFDLIASLAEHIWADSIAFGSWTEVTVKMYKRGSQGWLGKTLSATTTIPSNTCVIFRIAGDEADAKIPAKTIHSITLSI